MKEKKYGVCPIMRCQCIGAKCAWWLPNNECCAIAVLATSAVAISEALNTEIQVVNYEGT